MPLRDNNSARFLEKFSLEHCCVAIYAACLTMLLFGNGAGAASYSPPLDIGKPIAQGQAEELAKLSALTDIKTVHPGQTFNLVLIFDIQPQWHIYWKNPGEGSPPPDVVVEVPEGFKVGEIRWPRPIEMDSPIGMTYAYEKQAALFVPITAPKKLDVGHIDIKADVRWAVCRNICLWGSKIQTIKLSTSSTNIDLKANGKQIDPEIIKLSKRLPKPLSKTKTAQPAATYFDGTTLTITGPAHGKAIAKFFPGFTPGAAYLSARTTIKDDRFTISVDIEINRLNSLGRPIVLEGLIALGNKPDDPSYDFKMPLQKRSK